MSLLQLPVEAHVLLFILSFSNVVYFYFDTLWHLHSMSYSHFNHGKLCTCKTQYKKLGMCIDVDLVTFLGQQGTRHRKEKIQGLIHTASTMLS